MNWQPATGETFLFRRPIEFSRGAALKVRDRRWFRDEERRDIQGELAGWPEGPTYGTRNPAASFSTLALKTLLLAPLVIAAGMIPGALGNSYSPRVERRSQDPENEVEDFPAMWGAPGSLVRTAPWQLDPARRPKRYVTHVVVTDRRFLVLGMPVRKEKRAGADEVLWEVPRSRIARVEARNFRIAEDVKITFDDGSWCRLRCSGEGDQVKVVHTLSAPPVPCDVESLPADMREEVWDCVVRSGGTRGSTLLRFGADAVYLLVPVDRDHEMWFNGVSACGEIVGLPELRSLVPGGSST